MKATVTARRLREKRRSSQKRTALRLLGLTSQGTPRRLKIWNLGNKSQAEKKLIRQRITRHTNRAAGLRYDGQPRRNDRWTELAGLTGRERMMKRSVIGQRRRRAEKRQTPLDRAWREFRAGLMVPSNFEQDPICPDCGGEGMVEYLDAGPSAWARTAQAKRITW